MPFFSRYIGIDYSGAATPTSRLNGLQVWEALGARDPMPVNPPMAHPDRRWNWSRQEVAEWLINAARSGPRFIAGIDHAFSFPQAYFKRYELSNWDQFLADFARHWPTDEPDMYVDFVRDRGPQRTGKKHEFRLTDRWTSSAKSVFAFDVQGQVAKSTHAGIPWLRRIRQEVGERLHFWPFDGWSIDADRSAIVEVYPSIFRNRFPRGDRTVDQQDAYATARWLQLSDVRGALERYFHLPLVEDEMKLAELEGWIFGIA